MSLRLRLTLIYTLMLGGVLLLFSALVFGLVSAILTNHIDGMLSNSANELIGQFQVTTSGRLVTRSIMEFDPGDYIYFQVWDNTQVLQMARPASFQGPLDSAGLQTGQITFNTIQSNKMTMRVLSVPIVTMRGPAGVLQVASNIAWMERTQSALINVLIVLLVTAMLLVAIVSWIINGRTLAPLETVTDVATRITHADDLSRRIPYSGSRNDEVGTLIHAFNQTLERLEQLFTSQRRFVADVSHELRTPLTVIKGNIGLMRRIGKMDDESLSIVESEVDRMIRMVGDLLILAQAESGRLPLVLKPMELDTALLEVYNQMRLVVGEKLQMRIAEIDQIIINGDRDRIKQVLLNILGNAVQYTPAGGSITITLRKVGKKAQLIINDNGKGIPQKDLPHIFERFYRGEESRRREEGTGFGLGLPIAYWLVCSHGGTIEVDSQEGKGSTFCIWLPLLEENQE